MYVTINVMTVAIIRVRIKVTANVTATADLVDNESSWWHGNRVNIHNTLF